MDAAITKPLEEEGWHIDWGADLLADALADDAEDAGGRRTAALTAASVRAALLNLDLRKVGWS